MASLIEYACDVAAAIGAIEVKLRREPCPNPIETLLAIFHEAHARGNKIVLVGNGGSAAIASHTAIDLSKNAGIRAQAFNDASALTCLANDFNYEHVFSSQIEYFCARGDVLVAISSSGKSQNILQACYAANNIDMFRVTLSGFQPDNPLRFTGDMNFYVPSDRYGVVEIAHQMILHAVIDAAQVQEGQPLSLPA